MDLDSDAQNLPKIDASVSRQLVLDYLLHNCYGETARAFMKDDLDIAKESTAASASISSGNNNNSQQPTAYTTNGHSSLAASMNGLNGSSSGVGHHSDNMSNDASSFMELEKPMSSNTNTVTGSTQQQRTAHLQMVDAEGDSPMGEPLAEQEDGLATSTFTAGKLHAHHIDEQLKNLETRKAIRTLISNGDIGPAMDLCNSAFPGVLSIDPTSPLTTPASIQMNFKMQCQKFIEIVRQGSNKGPEALMFAQEVLAVFRKIDEVGAKRYILELDEILPILAYKDPEKSPKAHLLHQSERDKLADLMNSAVLGYNGMSGEPALQKIIKQATLVRELLAADQSKLKRGHKVPGRWRLSSFLEESG
ncbi:hypothetical protein BGW41_004295 [Actinomortierella wolfii]|nr:hypothetical protein BGW41_004295 [Actinomortierella wolfii]